MIDLNCPLEIQELNFGNLDEEQLKIAYQYNALGLLLTENANELFRKYMQESNSKQPNLNIEILLELLCSTRENTHYFNANTFEVNETDNTINDIILEKYISECQEKIQENNIHFNLNTMLITVVSLYLGNSIGHWGSIVIDITNRKIISHYLFR